MQDIRKLENHVAFGQGLFTLTEMAKNNMETFKWEAKEASQIT